MKIGELVVEPVFDGVMNVPVTAFKGTTDDVWAPHRQFLDADGRLEFALGGFLVRVPGGRLVLVDAGIGARSGPPMSGSGHFTGGELLNSLARQQVQPDDITDVVFTHLHFDHVGWASHEGAIVFPNATYRCDDRDWAQFRDNERTMSSSRQAQRAACSSAMSCTAPSSCPLRTA